MSTNSAVKLSKSQVSDLALVVARMQKNADKVEKDILQSEKLLAVDLDREAKKQAWMHQKEIADQLVEAEALLKGLFMDVDKAKKLRHPQAAVIENDVGNLHTRWVKDCAAYRDLYDKVPSVDSTQKIDWAPLLEEKLKRLKADAYGPKLSDVEKQIAAHNILHQQVEAYDAQLQPSTVTSKEPYAVLREKYAELLASSQLRRNHLASLYEYMQSCSKELVYLAGQQERILLRDWSDRMVNPRDVRTEYEKFKVNGLLAHESEVNKLQEAGDQLVAKKHPGSPTIRAHRDTVQAEWQAFLNLCLAQETHLDNVEEYKKFQLDAETLSESLERLASTLDPKSLERKSNPEVLLALEADEPAVRRNEQRLDALKELSSRVAPLKLRRIQPSRPTTAVSLCDWIDEEDSVRRGETLTLKSMSNNRDWKLQTSGGKITTLPGACFMVPPPDTEALDRVNSLNKVLTDLKSRRSALTASLRSPSVEVVRSQKTAAVKSSPEDPKAAELASELDRINRALLKVEKETLSRLRTPLDSRNPTQDLASRQQEHEKSALAVKKLESEKSAVQRELDPILAKTPLGPNASSLPPKLSLASSKLSDLNTLLELYSKKATASMFLEKQIQSVEGIVSGFEEQLTNDCCIADQPDALQNRSQQLKILRKDVASQKAELNKLGKELDLTQQACSPLQLSFNEYCPDICRQENQVKHLKNRYSNVDHQVQHRISLVQEAVNKHQDFQNALLSMDFFLVNLPNNAIKPTDDVEQITAKQDAQKKVTEDIKKKSEDLNRVKGLSCDLQSLLNSYEVKCKTYRGSLNDDDADEEPLPKKRRAMTEAVHLKEKDLLNVFSEVSAKNQQLLNQMETAKKLKARSDEKVSQVVVSHQLQLQSQQKDLEESDNLKKELSEELARRNDAERDLETYRKRFVSLKSRRGVERLEEREVVQYYRDPKLEVELQSLKNRIQDEAVKRSRTYTEVEIINEKIRKLEIELTKVEPRLVTKVLTEYERDPQLDKEAAKIRAEIQRLQQELQSRNTEVVRLRTDVTVLTQQQPKIREKVVKKEVVRLEKDPEMLKAVLTFQGDIAEEEARCKSLNDNIFSLRSQINTLERVIPTIQPKVVSKVVKHVQQDPETVEEFRRLQMALEEERDENASLTTDLSTFQLRHGELEKLRPKVELKEIINEIFRVDPETEVELLRLRKELQDCGRNRSDLEKEINAVLTTLSGLRGQKPKVEYKEVTQEVVKEEKSPEVIRELQRLNNQASRLQLNYDTTLELLNRLRKERDELKAEKSKVETKLVNKEVIVYENDPLLEKEADRIRRNVREEIQQRRSLEECLFELQNQYITLERQKPDEKVVVQEVVRLQKDHKQILEHEKLNKTLDEERKERRKLELEVRQLRALIQEMENNLAQMHDRQQKIQAESELRQIKARILELENAPPPVEEKIVVEEVLKVERDPNLEKLTEGIRGKLDTEASSISNLEKEIRNLKLKLEILQKEKSIEKVVYREVVRVEKDPAVEAEREHLRELVTQERNLRRDQEDIVQNISIKIAHLQTSKSAASQEQNSLISSRDALQREKDDLLRQLRTLESDRQSITVTFQQQSKLMSERNQVARQRSVKASSDIQQLEKEILNEKDKIHQKEILIMQLQSGIKKEDQTETHTRETNMSTKISILDPDTGLNLSPYDAYRKGLLDRDQYMHLVGLEYDWEEITSTGPDGNSIILQDRKSRKQFVVKEALKDGRLTQYDVDRYKAGKMSISEFALLVTGETKKPYIPPVTTPRSPSSPLSSMLPSLRSSQPSLTNLSTTPTSLRSSQPNLTNLSTTPTSLRSSQPNLTNLSTTPTSLRSSYSSLSSQRSSSLSKLTPAGEEYLPICGIFDATTEIRMSVRSALTRKLIDADTALKLLEAQAASGGIFDLTKQDRMSVHKAAEVGLIDSSYMHKLLSAQKAFTGVEDPVTKQRLSVGQAAQKGYIPQENAQRYMEAQYLTGGLVNPNKAGRLTVQEALDSGLIDSEAAKRLQDEASHAKELLDPVSKEKLSYKQAMDRCRRDVNTGLLLLPAASTDSVDAPMFSSYRFSSAYNRM